MIPGMIPTQMMMAPVMPGQMMMAPQMMMMPVAAPMVAPMGYPNQMMVGRPPYQQGMYPPQQVQQPQNQAQIITEQFNQLNLNNRTQQASRQTRQQIREAHNQVPSLKVQGLPTQNFLDLDFEKFFTNRGYRVKKAKVVLHNRTSRSLGYGYLQFFNEEELEKCFREMNNVILNGQALSMVRSQA